MFWGCLPFSRITVLLLFFILILIYVESFRVSNSSWSLVRVLYLAMVAALYVVFNCRSEIWMLFVMLVCVNFMVVFASTPAPEVADPISDSATPWNDAAVGFFVSALIFNQMMVQLYGRLFRGCPVSVDMFLFLNLAWHCLLDFLDISQMLELVAIRWDHTVAKFGKAFIVLAIFFHHQSFPSSISNNLARKKEKTESVTKESEKSRNTEIFLEVDLDHSEGYVQRSTSAPDSQMSEPTGSAGYTFGKLACQCCKFPLLLAKFAFQVIYYPKRPATEDEFRSVVVARKRSAVTSLLFVDTPFLFIRFTAHLQDNKAELVVPGSTSATFLFLVKNLICIFLQSLWIHVAQRMDRSRCYRDALGRNHPHVTDVMLAKTFEPADDERAAGFEHDHVTSEEYAHVAFNELLTWSNHELKTPTTEHLSLKGTRARHLAADTEVQLQDDRDPVSPISAQSTVTFAGASVHNSPDIVPAYSSAPSETFHQANRMTPAWSFDFRTQGSRPPDRASPEIASPTSRQSHEGLASAASRHLHEETPKLAQVPTFLSCATEGTAERPLQKADAVEKPGIACSCCGPCRRGGYWHKSAVSTTGRRTQRRIIWRCLVVVVGWCIGFFTARHDYKGNFAPSKYSEIEIRTILGVVAP